MNTDRLKFRGKSPKMSNSVTLQSRIPVLQRLNQNIAGRAFTWRDVSQLRMRKLCPCNASKQETDNIQKKSDPLEPEETLKKYGLEAGLFKIFTSKSSSDKPRGEQAKDLLKRYGSAYLITSISFAIVSFAACYALVSAGVDVAGVLSNIGLQVSDTSEKVGAFAIAYAAHKALSPIRFPPTVALTPVVAKWLGKEVDDD